MKALKQLSDGFANIPSRQRLTAIVAVTVVLALGGNLLLLKPQRVMLTSIELRTKANQTSMEASVRALAELDSDVSKGVDKFAGERETLAAFKRQIAEADMFFSGAEPEGARVDGLLRNLLQNDQSLTLESLKIVPPSVFYAPPSAQQQQKQKEKEDSIMSVLNKVRTDQPAPELVLSDKTLYKHGVEVTVKGSYPGLAAYLEKVQAFRQRLFWSEATITTSKYPEAKLRLIVNTLNDQPVTPLN